MTNVEKVKAGELAIFNDNKEVFLKVSKIIWPHLVFIGSYDYYLQKSKDRVLSEDEKFNGFESISATELLKLLESETVEAWSPKVGEMVEVSDGKGDWFPRKLLAVVDNQFKYIVESTTEHRSPICFKFCRPIPTKQLTRTEAEALLSDLKGETYKIVD